MPVRAVVAIGVVALVACVAVVLAQSGARQAGTNSILEIAQAAQLRSGERHCQPGETVPKDASGLRLLVGTYGQPVPELRVTVRDPDGRLVTDGRLPTGAHEGRVLIPLREVRQTTTGTEVCIQQKDGRRLVLYGQPPAIRLEWLRSGDETWYALVPAVAHRFSLGKAALFGSWWILVPALLMLLAAAAALRTVLRETEARP